MTFSTLGLHMLGHKLSLRHESAVASLLSALDRSKLYARTRSILLFTLASEGIGAAVLTFLFRAAGDPLPQAVWRGSFTAISAFCNAGFALQSNSLVPYQSDPWILHTVALLIVLGGLSPFAVLSLRERRKSSPAHVQARLVLLSSSVLLVLGAALIAAFEWTNALGGLDWPDRLHNAWFHSVTLRTAGFNSVALETMRPESTTLMLIWMFIGGSPGGTAGGIKTTTAFVLILAVVAAVRGRDHVLAFGHRLSHRTVYRALAITMVGTASGGLFLLGLELTQSMPPNVALFEVVSALCTVGLSLGGTAALDGFGKALIIVAMFLGRVGPVTLFLILSHRARADTWRRPELEIDVG
jgi:trk system potassium uptake protein TrkH